MNRTGHENVTYFVGPEVEHTPAFSKKTLFVIGRQPVEQIERMAREYRTPHIFMGANHSFSVKDNPSVDAYEYWDRTITALLDKGYWVTLDYQAHEHEDVLKMLNPGIWQCRTFVPLLGVRIPHVQTSSPNLTIKIDDVDFAATNPGVWCLHHHEITDSNRFTGWNEYSTDQVVDPMAGPAKILPVTIPVPMPEVVAAPLPEVTEPESGTDMNPQDIGLDLVPKMPAVEEVLVATTTTPAEAAEAYADATPEPSLAKKGKKK